MRSTIIAIFAAASALTGCITPASEPPLSQAPAVTLQYVQGSTVQCTLDPLTNLQSCNRVFTYPENVPGKGYIFCYGGTKYPLCASDLSGMQVTLFEDQTPGGGVHRYWTVRFDVYNNNVDVSSGSSDPFILYQLNNNRGAYLYTIPVEVPRTETSKCNAIPGFVASNNTTNYPPNTPSVYDVTNISYPVQNNPILRATNCDR